MTASAALAGAAVPATPAARSARPLIGVAAVLLGAFIATLNTRLTTFGLADARGGLGLGFDEGSWLTSVFSAGQMFMAPTAAWLGTVFGPRRFLNWATVIFGLSSLLLPFARDYDTIIGLELVRGLSVGAYIPAALGFVVRNLAPRWWIWGLAAYAFRFVFSQNVAGSIEAWYSESGRWEWIFWQNAALAPVMLMLIRFGMPRQGVDRVLLARTDWGGIVFAGLGFGLIYAGLDQGNRLDWLNSGTVSGLLAGGGLLLVAFLVNEAIVPAPLIHLKVVIERHVWIPALLVSCYGFGSTATAFILPDYLTRVQGLRDLQIGNVLNWIALPQFIVIPCVALLLQRLDARLVLAVGFGLIAVGSWMDTGLTHDWANNDFLASQIVEAVGLALGLHALVVYAIANITPAQAAAIATTIQTARLFGGEFGNAFIQTYVRVREQVHSQFVGLHLGSGSDTVGDRVAAYAGRFADRPSGSGDSTVQGLATIGNLVRREAYVLAYIDAFWVVAWVLAAALLLIALLPKPPPNPLTPPRIPT